MKERGSVSVRVAIVATMHWAQPYLNFLLWIWNQITKVWPNNQTLKRNHKTKTKIVKSDYDSNSFFLTKFFLTTFSPPSKRRMQARATTKTCRPHLFFLWLKLFFFFGLDQVFLTALFSSFKKNASPRCQKLAVFSSPLSNFLDLNKNRQKITHTYTHLPEISHKSGTHTYTHPN